MTYVAFETEEEQLAYWRLMREFVGGDDDGDESGSRGFCPTGEGGGVDNSCGTKGGGAKGGGGSVKGRKGGRKKPDRIPTRKPSKAEVALAASEGTSEKHVAARKAVASHFLHSQGSYFDRNPKSPTYEKLVPLDETRYEGQMAAIDWSRPVKVGPPPGMPPPEEFVQWQAPGNVPPSGGYFSTLGTEPERLGIGRKATKWTDPDRPVVEKVPYVYVVDGAPRYIQSTAARAVDTWSAQGKVQVASGGGPQWFVPEAQSKGGVRQLRLKRGGSRRSARAFCPGASPPDNSCSPANKEDGSSAVRASFAAVRAANKKAMDSLRLRVSLAEGRAIKRFEAASETRKSAISALSQLSNQDRELRLQYSRLKDSYELTGDKKSLEAMNKVAAALNALDPQLAKAYEDERQAAIGWRKAHSEVAEAAFRVLGRECQQVDKEDGLTLRQRRDAAKAIESAHSVEATVDGYVAKNKDNALINSASPDLARQPYATEQREAGLRVLREVVNNSLHAKSLSAPIEYVNGVRANASGAVVIADYTDYKLPKGSSLPADTLEKLGMSGVREMTQVGRVQISPTDSRGVLIHEYGHQIEHGNGEAARLCADFLESRTKGERVVSLAERFPSHGYASDEKGSPDDFARAIRYVRGGPLEVSQVDYYPEVHDSMVAREAFYAGKRYASQGKTTTYTAFAREGEGQYTMTTIGATEVLSVGMELMAENAARFAKADPEWFDLVAGVTTGRLLQDTRAQRRERDSAAGARK